MASTTKYVKGGISVSYDPPIDEDEPNEYFIPYGLLDEKEKEEYSRLKKLGKLES